MISYLPENMIKFLSRDLTIVTIIDLIAPCITEGLVKEMIKKKINF